MFSPHSIFKMLSDPDRLRLLLLLDAEGELCVCELVHALTLPQPRVSQQLALLRQAHLLSFRKQGRWIHYSLAAELPAWLPVLLAGMRAEQPELAQALARLQGMGTRPERIRACCED